LGVGGNRQRIVTEKDFQTRCGPWGKELIIGLIGYSNPKGRKDRPSGNRSMEKGEGEYRGWLLTQEGGKKTVRVSRKKPGGVRSKPKGKKKKRRRRQCPQEKKIQEKKNLRSGKKIRKRGGNSQGLGADLPFRSKAILTKNSPS